MIRKNEDEVSENIIKNKKSMQNDSEIKHTKPSKKRIKRWISVGCFLLLGLWLLHGNISLQTTMYEIQVKNKLNVCRVKIIERNNIGIHNVFH